eukprot:1738115-Alexandrium_andersonii.AAC.1
MAGRDQWLKVECMECLFPFDPGLLGVLVWLSLVGMTKYMLPVGNGNKRVKERACPIRNVQKC